MTLHFRIFHPIKPKGWDLTFSERLSYWSLGISISIALLCMAFEKMFSVGIPYLMWITVLGFFGHVISFFARIGEHENVNGYFDGNIIFREEFMEINSQEYFYKNISSLKYSIGDYYGKFTNNGRYGPMYKNGVSNYISFSVNGENKFFYFELNSEYLIDKFYYHFINVICLEKIKYQRDYLNLIPNDFRDYSVFKNFIIKLIEEKRIDCSEGLLIHGYDSDNEAKKLRAKHC